MSSNTKIVVLRLKAIIYTVIFIILGVALIFLLIFMFGKKKDDSNSTPTSSYIPGVYSSSIVLNDNVVDIQVVVDEYHNHVSIAGDLYGRHIGSIIKQRTPGGSYLSKRKPIYEHYPAQRHPIRTEQSSKIISVQQFFK